MEESPMDVEMMLMTDQQASEVPSQAKVRSIFHRRR